MSTSIDKVYGALNEIADMDDQDLQEALPVPIPPAMARALLPAVAKNIPDNPADLDEFLTQVGDFCHGLRSDEVINAAT